MAVRPFFLNEYLYRQICFFTSLFSHYFPFIILRPLSSPVFLFLYPLLFGLFNGSIGDKLSPYLRDNTLGQQIAGVNQIIMDGAAKRWL
jgi:hypothetical protein